MADSVKGLTKEERQAIEVEAMNQYGNRVDIKRLKTDALEALTKYSGNINLSPSPGAWTGTDASTQALFKSYQIPQPNAVEVTPEDTNRHMKIFIHFAKLFVERFAKWEIQPEPDDPFHKIKLVRKDIGAAIFVFGMNQIGVFGGPDAWTRKQGETYIDPHPFIAKVQIEVFYGWALGGEEPEWIR
jgi:hypothetical protein